MYRIIAVSVILFLAASQGTANTQDAWVAKGGTDRNLELKDAIMSKDSLYIATKSTLFIAKDSKDDWDPVFLLPEGGSNEITCLAGVNKTILLGTKRGLYRSDDAGHRWSNIFRTILPGKNNISCIGVSSHDRSLVVIVTGRGIYLSRDMGVRWQDISGRLKNIQVKCLTLNKEYIYAGAESGLYERKADNGVWERIIVRSATEHPDIEEAQDEAEEGYGEDSSIKTIAIDGDRIYAGYSKNIIYCDDRSKGWERLPCEGLAGEINHILISGKNKKIFCATRKGVFEFDSSRSRWSEFYKGMGSNSSVSRLIFANEEENMILAASDIGIYSYKAGEYIQDKYLDIEKSTGVLKATFDGEPAYLELQSAAIKYADVSPEKIKRWRADSKIRSILPKISIGIDKNRSDTYDIYTSATRDYVVMGPDDITDGWNIGLSWEISNLIWNDDQLNIDVRSRLNTQLRNDILDDLRRAYFERKRLQFEIMTNPARDLKMRFEKELRLQELTRSIDDLTGNYLSQSIEKRGK